MGRHDSICPLASPSATIFSGVAAQSIEQDSPVRARLAARGAQSRPGGTGSDLH